MYKDLNYIVKRVIIGILIGMFFLLFKSHITYAATIDNAVGTAYYQTMNCTRDSLTLNCSVGSSNKFTWQPNNANNTDDFNVIIPNNSEYYVLVKNLIIKYDFANTITIDNTNRTIQLQMGNGSWLSSNRNSGELDINMAFMPVDYYDSNNSLDTRYVPHANYNFKPYYATWTDTSDIQHNCGIILNVEGTQNYFTMNFDIPLGSEVKSISLYLGDYRLTDTYRIRQLTNTSGVYVLNSNYWIKNDSANWTSSFSQFSVHYNLYRTKSNTYDNQTDSNRGLYLYQQGKLTYSQKFYVPKNNTELLIVSNDYTNNSYKWYFNNYSQVIQDYIQDTIPTIENELNPPEEEEDSFQDSLDAIQEYWETSLFDFTNVTGNQFTTLFGALFSYPINRLSEFKDIDLVRNNINGTPILNSLLCTRNSGIENMTGSYNPYEVVFWRNYSFKLPCPHTEVYPLLKYGNYGFYGNVFKGASLNVGIVYSFADIWLTIQHGLLVYLMFVQILNFHKYVIDFKKTEIEVIEL